jgi:hypothetical protein
MVIKKKMNRDLENLLRSLKGLLFTFQIAEMLDSFIAHATYQIFERIDLEYEIGSKSELYPNQVVICGGGGNLVSPYPEMVTFLR